MSSESGYSRKKPFPATLTANRCLTAAGSEKETRHFEISIQGSGLKYEVGDSLGVLPANSPELIEGILKELHFTGAEEVAAPDGRTLPLHEALLRHYIITEPSKLLLQAVSKKDTSGEFLATLLDPAAAADLSKYLWGRDILDILREFTAARFEPEEFVKCLRKLQPRLYSIASSQKAVGESVHLTVAVVRYHVEHSPRQRNGVCSTFLAERAEGIPVFIHTAKYFRMPENPESPLIMVGPGTGVAPFRAFLQDRGATGTRGPAWLFFGEQHAATDFLYEEEWTAALREGRLSRLTTAFSRDQANKIYVQHRMQEHGAELFDWLQRGAYFYVCGDAARMAKDVDAALHRIIETHGGLSEERAREYVDAMKSEKRYRKDVY
ncbi:MAG: sulfite reductase subunit alpha [Chthoniobacterales bacterium]|nr:sulfite reductase subunit alpha [Chthoniobacterales bacterium]